MIINPNVNPEEQRMEQTRKSKIWESLVLRIEELSIVSKNLSALRDKVTYMRLDGPSDTFENIGEYVECRNKFLSSAQAYIDVMSKWEQSYFEWMAEEKGEEVVTAKLAQAMKGLDNE
jgi:hypothetical protein